MRRIIFALTLFCLGSTGASAGILDSSYGCDWDNDKQEMVNCRISCDQYVAFAVEAAQHANAGKCGLTGPRWSTNPDDHRKACPGTSISVAENPQAVAFLKGEEHERARDSMKCDLCQYDIPGAMKNVAEAKAMHCKFLDKSPLWPSSEAGQMAVCMGSEWWAAIFVLMHTDNLAKQAADLAACKAENRENQLRAGASQGKSYSTMRREQKERALITGARKVLPCPPELGPNCNKPQKRVIINPGLLESDGGFARQGPALTGTPVAPQAAPNSYSVR